MTSLQPLLDRARALLAGLPRQGWVRSITPIGWALLVGGVVSAAIGWRWGWLEFRSLAIMAAVVLAVAGLSILRSRQHVVDLELYRPRVQVGEEALGRVAVTAAGERSAGATTMELPVGSVVAAFHVGVLRPGDEHEELFSIPTRRRGIVTVGPVRSVQADPLGAISRQKILTAPVEFYIHPQIAHVDLGAVGVLKDVEGITTSSLSSSDVSFHALREYVPGDDRRSVHWRTTARTGTLMVRQFEETMRAHLLILLSTLADDYDDEDSFELAVSTAASLGVAALRADRQLSVLTSAGELRFGSPLGLLDAMSGVTRERRGDSLRELAVRGGAIAGASVAAFITGSTAPTVLRAAHLALPVGLRAFGIRAGASQLRRQTAGDLSVLDVPRLGDLPLAVRSIA